MKKRRIMLIFAILILFAFQVCAQDDLWFYRSSYLVLEQTISTGFDVVAKPNSKIDYVVANISFFPKQTGSQVIMASEYDPVPQASPDMLTFTWKSPPLGNIDIKIKNKVKVLNAPPRIKKKIGFPLKESGIPEEELIYTEPSEIIDMNSRIIGIASELASGEDDLFAVVDKIANWVNANIEYNLTTVTSEASQKSSWVIEHREGVCDELTSLFISMLRSLGIPARFISGISYTNLDIFENKWGPHGWAEVYFPGYGWVPFDVTYGEYGWVDPTHIYSKAAEDAGKFTSQYVWRAEPGVSLNVSNLRTDVTLLEKGQPKNPAVLISASVLKENVGFGSYNLVTAEVRNLADYYQSLDVYISYTTRIIYMDENRRHLPLKPGEAKKAYWIIKTDDRLDQRYMYTFPIVVYTPDNISSKTSFMAVDDAKSYPLDFVNNTLMQNRIEEKLTYSSEVTLNCNTDKKEYYDYEKPIISCAIKNSGNVFLKGMYICLEDECVIKNIGITEEKYVDFTVHRKSLGENDLKLSAKNEQVSKILYMGFKMTDRPEIGIDSMEHPHNATYRSSNLLKFHLKKESGSNPQDVRITVKVNRKKKTLALEELNESRMFEVAFSGKDLSIGKNNITVSVEYGDKNGKRYSLERDSSVNLVDADLFQKFMIFMRTIL